MLGNLRCPYDRISAARSGTREVMGLAGFRVTVSLGDRVHAASARRHEHVTGVLDRWRFQLSTPVTSLASVRSRARDLGGRAEDERGVHRRLVAVLDEAASATAVVADR